MEINKLTPLIDELRYLESIDLEMVKQQTMLRMYDDNKSLLPVSIKIDESFMKLLLSYIKSKIQAKQKELKKALEKVNG